MKHLLSPTVREGGGGRICKREGPGAPDDALFDGVIERHEELRVLSDAAHKVPDEDVEAVRGRGLDSR